MSLTHIVTAAGLFAGICSAQNQDPSTWIQSQYPQIRMANLEEVIEQGTQAGLAQTPQQLLELKKSLRQLQGKDRQMLPLFRQPSLGPTTGNLPIFSIDNAVEHESNDGWQWADEMSGPIASGSCAELNDVDCWRYVAAQSGFYTFEVKATGTFPIADSWLVLRNHKGDSIVIDDNGAGANSLSRINVFLPAGTYFLEVSGYNGTGGGTYEIHATRDNANVIPLTNAGAAGTTRLPASGTTHDVFSFTVQDSTVAIEIASGGSDTALVVQRADGGIVFANDDSFWGVFDAAADIDLPAGQYFAYVWDARGFAGTPFSMTFDELPKVFGDLSTLGATTDWILGDESLRLARVELSQPTHIVLETGDALPAPIGDTNVALLDRDLDYILDVEDGLLAGPTDYYGRVSMSLPAGRYWVAVTPFLGSWGDYALTCATSPYAPTGSAQLGPMTGSIAGFGDVNTYVVDSGTQASVQVRGSDFYFGILGPDGEVSTNTLCGLLHPQAGEVLRGSSTIFTWDRFDYTATLDIQVTPPLYVAADGITVMSRAKDGDDVWMFANFQGQTAGYNFNAGDRGFLCLPLDALLLTIDHRRAPATGTSTWFQLPVGLTGVDLQTGDVHNGLTWPAPAFATWRNVFSF